MSSPSARKGRHAAPRARGLLSGRLPNGSTGRRLAATAAALTVGALPLACAPGAAAASAAPADLAGLNLPDLGLPFGLPYSIDPLSADLPLARDLPLVQTLGAATPAPGDVAQAGAEARSAESERQVAASARQVAFGTGDLANAADRLLAGQARRATAPLAEVLPLHQPDPMPQLTAASGAALRLVPHVLHQGALGKLTTGFAPQAEAVTGGVIGRAAPLAAQLRRSGVPTVGDLTGKLSETPLPLVGSVGNLTRTLPVTSALGADSPVTDALQNVGSL